uniref:Uncharacterized protein n=1 Tax=Anguilla anguilla TaxID=7936 RepID=A0A0E9SWH8_ANGAN
MHADHSWKLLGDCVMVLCL